MESRIPFNLLNKLVNNKWMILPNYHTLLLKQVTDYSVTSDLGIIPPNKKAELINASGGNTIKETGLVGVVYIDGSLSKQPSLFEQELFGLTDIDNIYDTLKEQANDPAIKYIVCVFNSPGGETTGIAELGELIRDIDENQKPIYIWTETLMASAAYWLGSQGRKIGMLGSSQVGSVGVYSLVLDATKQLELQGTEIIPFSAGKYKMMGHEFRKLTDEERKIIQDDVDKQYAKFKDVVTSKRKQIKDEDLQGLVFEGEEAFAKGFVDFVGNSLDDFLAYIEANNLEI